MNAWYIIIPVIIIGLGSFMVLTSHDILIQGKYVDDLHAQWLSKVNSTIYCPDLKDWIDHEKDFWFKSNDYSKYVQFYQQNKCDEVLQH